MYVRKRAVNSDKYIAQSHTQSALELSGSMDSCRRYLNIKDTSLQLPCLTRCPSEPAVNLYHDRQVTV